MCSYWMNFTCFFNTCLTSDLFIQLVFTWFPPMIIFFLITFPQQCFTPVSKHTTHFISVFNSFPHYFLFLHMVLSALYNIWFISCKVTFTWVHILSMTYCNSPLHVHMITYSYYHIWKKKKKTWGIMVYQNQSKSWDT